jgi:hypothetical protein
VNVYREIQGNKAYVMLRVPVGQHAKGLASLIRAAGGAIERGEIPRVVPDDLDTPEVRSRVAATARTIADRIDKSNAAWSDTL